MQKSFSLIYSPINSTVLQWPPQAGAQRFYI